MGTRDWFRTSDWDVEARSDFESRLARSRASNRPQYLRVKAVTLREAGQTAAAQELLGRVLDDYPDSFDAPFCAELLGSLALEAGNFPAAEAHYRDSLRRQPDQNTTTGEVHIGLAEALVAQGRNQEAVDALNYAPVERLSLNKSICRWNVVLSDAAHALGEREVAAAAAQRALALLEVPDQFNRHPGVGRAVLTEKEQARLRTLASGDAPPKVAKRRWFNRSE